MKKTLSAILAALLLIASVAVLGACNKDENTDNYSATSKYFNYTSDMVDFHVYTNYHNFFSTYENQLASIGFDAKKSLKEQRYDDQKTWYDYFRELAEKEIKQIVALASKAKDSGIDLTDDDKKDVEEQLTAYKGYATELKFPTLNDFLKDVYCEGVTENTLKSCLEIRTLASKYIEILTKGYNYSDGDIATYVKNNVDLFYVTDYVCYPVYPETTEEMTEAEVAAAIVAAKNKADELLSQITDIESFKALINKNEAKNEEDTKDYSSTYTFNSAFRSEDNKVSEWAFDDSRKVGDKAVVESTASGTASYSICFMLKTKRIDDTVTKNVRHILITPDGNGGSDKAKTVAEDILAKYKNGELTEQAFGELAKTYSEDTGSKSEGGLYTNVSPDYMVSEFDAWIFDPSRKAGDVDIVKSDYGYHIMYFVGDGGIIYKLQAESRLMGEQFEKDVEALIADYPVEFK